MMTSDQVQSYLQAQIEPLQGLLGNNQSRALRIARAAFDELVISNQVENNQFSIGIMCDRNNHMTIIVGII